jgi:hypothetical protein
MAISSEIIEVTAENLREHPGAVCFINPKNEYYQLKVNWLLEQFKKGLKIKLLYVEGEKSPKGFIEYIPGDFCWRPVEAKGYMFIHCLWTTGKKYQQQGLGGLLINEVEKDASGMDGVAILTSDGSFMIRKDIFLKSGYRLVAGSGKDQLMVKQFREAPLPSFIRSNLDLSKHKGLTIIYSKQCPWVARFIEEVKPVLSQMKLDPEMIEIKTCAEAQNAPSVYGAFTLISDGKVLADRYISTTRFINIVKKEIN